MTLPETRVSRETSVRQLMSDTIPHYTTWKELAEADDVIISPNISAEIRRLHTNTAAALTNTLSLDTRHAAFWPRSHALISIRMKESDLILKALCSCMLDFAHIHLCFECLFFFTFHMKKKKKIHHVYIVFICYDIILLFFRTFMQLYIISDM